jgi:hypothetical protein
VGFPIKLLVTFFFFLIATEAFLLFRRRFLFAMLGVSFCAKKLFGFAEFGLTRTGASRLRTPLLRSSLMGLKKEFLDFDNEEPIVREKEKKGVVLLRLSCGPPK